MAQHPIQPVGSINRKQTSPNGSIAKRGVSDTELDVIGELHVVSARDPNRYGLEILAHIVPHVSERTHVDEFYLFVLNTFLNLARETA